MPRCRATRAAAASPAARAREGGRGFPTSVTPPAAGAAWAGLVSVLIAAPSRADQGAVGDPVLGRAGVRARRRVRVHGAIEPEVVPQRRALVLGAEQAA